jgi:hypothetical protein
MSIKQELPILPSFDQRNHIMPSALVTEVEKVKAKLDSNLFLPTSEDTLVRCIPHPDNYVHSSLTPEDIVSPTDQTVSNNIMNELAFQSQNTDLVKHSPRLEAKRLSELVEVTIKQQCVLKTRL